ncbi:hypothetical protein L6164_012079 [Bauhinia variegata]|uniref:Uncharacterized protein n=1 Tax=Bauhinia variegata TaxID=167791 RepID=A0ACB9PA44_BAUVA|nr:hypothetical protein L6164_012079 [Bauhinia variegata]
MKLGSKMVCLYQNLMEWISEFTVGDGYFCPALAKAVKTMKKGERVHLTVRPQYAFGDSGRPASGDEGAVPPNATLQID